MNWREGHPGVVHPVPAAERGLVVDAIGEPDPRSPGVPLRVLERPRSRTTRTAAREDHGPGDVAGARVGCVRIEGRVLVVLLGAGGLVVQAQPRGQGELRVDLELPVDPGREVALVPGGLGVDGLIGDVDLPQEERGEGIAGLAEVVAGGVVAAGPEPVEVEVAGRSTDAPALVPELVVPVLEAHLEGVPAPDPRQVGGELPAIVLLVPEGRPRDDRACCRGCCRRS